MPGHPSQSEVSRGSSGVLEDDVSLAVDLDGDSTVKGGRSDINAENLDLKNETRKTSVVRCLVITTLLTTAAIVANVALIMALNEEEVGFKKEYGRLSTRVIQHFLEVFEETISAADSLASQFYFGEDDQFTFLWSIPEFEAHAEGIRKLSSSTTVSYSPLLKGQEQRREFEAYASTSFDETARKKFNSTYLPHEGKYNFGSNPLVSFVEINRQIQEGMYRVENGVAVNDDTSIFFAPMWQVAPFNNATEDAVMFNQMSESQRSMALQRLVEQNGFVVSNILYGATEDSLHNAYSAPVMALYYPIFKDTSTTQSSVIGILTLEIGLESLFEQVLHGFENEPVTAVVETSCGKTMSFYIQGSQVSFLGSGDLREDIPDVGEMELVSSTFQAFDDMVHSFADTYPTIDEVMCSYRVNVFPTVDFYVYHLTNRPLLIEGLVGLVFLFTVGVFLGYDCLVERRQRRMLAAAQRTNALVGSIFPQAVRDRLYMQAEKNRGHLEAAPKLRLKTFMANDNKNVEAEIMPGKGSEPIADLFPVATILFSDVSGFSAWSSEREPSQVFTLLETLFTSFDTIARRLGVFKVETVGDVYVAASGIPEPREDHAIVMVRFANALWQRTAELTKALESTLGPGTADLCMRVGIHSGPVTAGVLRGEKSRFQLFGDTMNTGARMQSTSNKGMIQLSTDTANLLIDAGKAHWIEPREDLVEAKGKGTMQTYWLKMQSKDTVDGSRRASRVLASSNLALEHSGRESGEAKERLIDWNLTTMMSLLERIVASRGKKKASRVEREGGIQLRPSGWKVMDEVKEVIELAPFDSQAVLRSENHASIPPVVRNELRDYIAQISSLYLDNPFHNFAHASHVTMSCHKLFKRINRPDEVNYSHANKADVARELYDATYGISSDPLTQLAIVISALIHDAGHTGVPNGQLAKEHPNFVSKYGTQSLAEQRSLDISLELLEAPCYANLRACMIPTKEEQERFRQLIINSVLATDIFDKDLGTIRKARWDKAFGRDPNSNETEDARAMDRKATIVLEHVIQASDVAHTMQHWKIYQKWNQNLYEEMYKAYREGRSDNDPTLTWYKGELWFFDNYVIPLAKKLKDCGVFGISSDEYLHYAQDNRHEWAEQGEAMVERMSKCVRDAEGVTNKDELPSLNEPMLRESSQAAL